jgi:multidrug efflux pump subunit AcrA (membrane-fusion protein)
MSKREKLFLILGILVGVGIAAAALFFASRYSVPAVSSTASSSEALPVAAPDAQGGHSGHAPSAEGPNSEPRAIQLTPEEQQAAGVQLSEAVWRQLQRDIRTTGKVEEAETRLFTASARVGGRIDDLLVNFTGQAVRRGEPLAVIYSPELVTTAEEYRLAAEARRSLGAEADSEAKAQAEELVESSRRRLELWGLTPGQIQEISASPQPSIHITIYSPVSGIVTERKVTEGQYVKEGDALYTVADLSTVWVLAQVYESDLPSVAVGQQVEITSEALPGSTLHGRVSFIEPLVDPQTRTAPVRIEVRNPQLRLRPGMYVTAVLKSKPQRVLAVPRSAVIVTGEQNIVYVALDGGVFESRRVTLGEPEKDIYPVLSGLKPGEKIVTNGAFMIDSQTRITGGMTGLFGGVKAFQGAQKSEKREATKYSVSLRTDPDPPKGGAENTFQVQVTGPEGKQVPDAQVSVTLVMPAMPAMNMPEMRSVFELKWNGHEYVGKGTLGMPGTWSVLVEARRGGATLATHFAQMTAR